MTIVLPLLVLLLAPSAARAQQQQQPAPAPAPQTTVEQAPIGEAIDDDEVLRIDSNLVHIPALVTETTGRTVGDLRIEDFELRIDGQLRPIGELGRADTPIALTVLFDNSSSLSTAREFEKQAATRFLTRIVRPIDRASIYSVSTVPVLVRPFTNSVSVLVRTVEQFPAPEGATALFDAVAEAATYLRGQEGRRVIVIVSDGNDTISEQSFDQALQRALKNDCQIYVVGTGDIESQNMADTIARRRLSVMAAQTGGALYIPRTVTDLDYAFEQISRDISQQYVLTYVPENDPTDGRFRAIDLRVKNRPGVRVRAREGYYAAMGQERVRPRTIRGAKAAETAAAAAPAPTQRNGSKPTAAAQREAQPASLDPLYAPVASAPARAEQKSPSEVTFRTRAAPERAAGSRRGPQEGEAHPEPERVAETRAAGAAPQTQQQPEQANLNGPAFVPSDVAAARRPREMSFEVARGGDAATSPSNATPVAAQPAEQPRADGHAGNGAQTRTSLYDTAAPTPAPRNDDPQPSSAPQAAPSPTPESDSPPVVSKGVLNGRALRLPAPVYPQAAKSARAGGNVTVEVEIDEHGRVVSAQAISGHRMLQGPAAQAARQARFSPTLLSGRPVRIKGTIIYNFIVQ